MWIWSLNASLARVIYCWLTANISMIGMVTNGEFSSIRMRGNTRPLHVLQLKAEARSNISKVSVKSLLAFLTPTG